MVAAGARKQHCVLLVGHTAANAATVMKAVQTYHTPQHAKYYFSCSQLPAVIPPVLYQFNTVSLLPLQLPDANT
jgi:hypothetical protein